MLLTQLELAQTHLRAVLTRSTLDNVTRRHLETALDYVEQAHRFYELDSPIKSKKRDFDQEYNDEADKIISNIKF